MQSCSKSGFSALNTWCFQGLRVSHWCFSGRKRTQLSPLRSGFEFQLCSLAAPLPVFPLARLSLDSLPVRHPRSACSPGRTRGASSSDPFSTAWTELVEVIHSPCKYSLGTCYAPGIALTMEESNSQGPALLEPILQLLHHRALPTDTRALKSQTSTWTQPLYSDLVGLPPAPQMLHYFHAPPHPRALLSFWPHHAA